MPASFHTDDEFAFAERAALRLTQRERYILSLIRRFGSMTRSAIIKETGLSGTAVFRSTQDLVTKGYAVLGDPVKEGRGQPSNLIELQDTSAFSFGLSVMTDTARAVLMDLKGQIVADIDLSLPGMPREAILLKLKAFLDTQLKQAGRDEHRLIGGCIAIAGFFTGASGQVNPASELDDWALIDLREVAERTLGTPVLIENIANASAVGEGVLGSGQNYGSYAYVSVAAGFGGALVLNGQLWRGAFGNAGEFAALLKHAGTEPPNLETLRETLSAQGVDAPSVKALAADFDPDWPGVEEWTAARAPAFTLLAHLLQYSCDVEAVILGGRLPIALARKLADACAIDPEERGRRVRRGMAHPAPAIVAAQVGPDSATIGAAILPLAACFFIPLTNMAVIA
nr:ROK family protein [uncultured Hyphomonas sp.]